MHRFYQIRKNLIKALRILGGKNYFAFCKTHFFVGLTKLLFCAPQDRGDTQQGLLWAPTPDTDIAELLQKFKCGSTVMQTGSLQTFVQQQKGRKRKEKEKALFAKEKLTTLRGGKNSLSSL